MEWSAIPKRAMQRSLNFKTRVFFSSLSSLVPRWSGNETTLSGLGTIYYDMNNICSKKSLQKKMLITQPPPSGHNVVVSFVHLVYSAQT